MTISNQQTQIDPLYTIFEQHLYNFQDSEIDRKTFIGNVVKEYVGYLRKMNIMVPRSVEVDVLEELASQVHTMLVKKIYGCLTIQEYQKQAPPVKRRKARSKYSRLSRAVAKLKVG